MKEGWEIKKLGEVCDINSGSTPLRGNKLFWENGTIPWFTIEDIRVQGRTITYTNQNITELALNKLKLFPIDTVLLCCTASVGEYALTKIPITSNQQFNGLSVIDKNQLFPNYLLHFCSTLKDTLLNLSGKTTIDFVSQSKVKEIEIPLPPLPEQQRIVQLLDEAFEKIDTLKANAERNLQNAKELFQSALTEELKPKEGWEEKSIGEICNLIDSLHITPKYSQEGYPMVRVTEIKYGELDVSKALKVDEKTYKEFSRKHIPKTGDIVFSRVGASFGVSSLVVNDIEFCLGQNTVFIIPKINSLYSYYFLNSRLARDQMNKLVAGAAQPTISLKSIKELIMPIPTVVEQQTIVEHLDALSARCKALEINYQKTITQCDEMKKAVLAKAFNGEL